MSEHSPPEPAASRDHLGLIAEAIRYTRPAAQHVVEAREDLGRLERAWAEHSEIGCRARPGQCPHEWAAQQIVDYCRPIAEAGFVGKLDDRD